MSPLPERFWVFAKDCCIEQEVIGRDMPSAPPLVVWNRPGDSIRFQWIVLASLFCFLHPFADAQKQVLVLFGQTITA